jgi:aminoglycoside 3-N-acetyltransferase
VPSPYPEIVGDEDAFELIGQEGLAAGCGVTDRVGDAELHLFEAKHLLAFAVGWLEDRFGSED